MKKSYKISIGVAVVFLIATVSYSMSGGSLFEGRLTKFSGLKKSYIASVPLCLTPEEFQKKYYTAPAPDSTPPVPDVSGRPVDGTNTGTDSRRGKDNGGPIVINPIIGGSGSKGGTVAPGGTDKSGSGKTVSSEDGNNQPPVMEECSCARNGYTWLVKGPDGKNVKHQCYVADPMKCVDPEFQCPDGTNVDIPALIDLCANKKKKNCFSAKGPDNTSKDDAMCKALLQYDKNWTCVTEEQCKKLVTPNKQGTLGGMIKNGEISIEDVLSCHNLYGTDVSSIQDGY